MSLSEDIRKIDKGMALTHMHSKNYSKDTVRLDGLVEHAGHSVALELLEGTQDPQLTRSNGLSYVLPKMHAAMHTRTHALYTRPVTIPARCRDVWVMLCTCEHRYKPTCT